MVAEGKAAPEISERLAALVHVLLDWSEQKVEMPNSKTPWDWDEADPPLLHSRALPESPWQP